MHGEVAQLKRCTTPTPDEWQKDINHHMQYSAGGEGAVLPAHIDLEAAGGEGGCMDCPPSPHIP